MRAKNHQIGARALALGVALLWPLGAHADAPTVESLTALGEAVRGTDGAARREAIAAFAALGDDALPALTARVLAARRERRGGEDGYRAIGDFGRAAGAALPSDAVDVVGGIAPVLDAGASAVHGRMAERLLLLRALERIGTARAVIAMLPILSTDMIAFRWEARHLVRRMGRVTIAALIRAAQSPVPEVDLFAGWGFGELGVLDAGHAVQDQSAESLSEIIRAYAEVKHLGAMPMVASFVGDDRPIVREAAHAGMLAYAENGIWQLRTLHQSRLGRPATPGATFRDLLARLEAHADDRRAAPFRTRIDAAARAFASGDVGGAARLARDVEARAPAMRELAALAEIHAEVAARALAAGDLDRASEGWQRALRIAPDDASAATWTSRLAEIETARLARVGIEPWPDAPVLAAAKPAPRDTRPTFLLAALGALLLAFPMIRARLPSPAGIARRCSERVAQWKAERRTAAPRVDEITFEEPAMEEQDVIVTPALDAAAEAARVARARLELAAERARARLGTLSLPPFAAQEAAPAEAAMPETAPIVIEAVAPRAEAPDEDADRMLEAEIARALEAELAEASLVVAEAAPAEPALEPQRRHARPARRAALSPELFFGAQSKSAATKRAR